MKKFYAILFLVFPLLLSCNMKEKATGPGPENPEQMQETVKAATDSALVPVRKQEFIAPSHTIDTKEVTPMEVLAYARTLIGIPYLFASTDPEKGFDCSGFVTHVFNHFNIAIPRSSVEFTNQGTEVDFTKAEPGDLILFTGTDSSTRIVGHMGIVESKRNDSLFFIHSSSGKANGVVITPFNKHYQDRFVKTIRIFPDRFFVNID